MLYYLSKQCRCWVLQSYLALEDAVLCIGVSYGSYGAIMDDAHRFDSNPLSHRGLELVRLDR